MSEKDGKDGGIESAVKGVVDGVVGKAKEVAGAIVGDKSMQEAGRAQQDKADAQREVAEKEAEAEKARARAKVDDARQQQAEK